MPVHQWMADFWLPHFTVAFCAWVTFGYHIFTVAFFFAWLTFGYHISLLLLVPG